MPVFRFDKTLGIARGVKALVNRQGTITRGAAPDAEQREGEPQDLMNARRHTTERREKIKSRRQELAQIKNKLRTAKDEAEVSEYKRNAKRVQVEISQLERELRSTPDTEIGALPDFVVIGAAKCGTTFFYHLLTQHPLVDPAAVKEPHYFNRLFDEGTEWYRRCFPRPRWKDGRRTITGEASPGYIWDLLAPQRMAEVIPQARLIALLRNPVDRTYSDYHHRVKNGRVTRTFERNMKDAFADPSHRHLSKGIYVDHLLRWSRFFGKEQMLVLKSEDFFERPVDTLKVALDFLGLPEWEPDASELRKKRNAREYEEMDPATRRRLEEYFEPHNRRLYDYLGVDFGW